MGDSQSELKALEGRRVSLPGHFDGVVTIEGVRAFDLGAEIRVRLPSGDLNETILSASEVAELLDHKPEEPLATPVDADKLRLLVESARIRLAYAYDKHFAVSLSGIRTLPHQIEAVYPKDAAATTAAVSAG
jgi:hypothetical protein